MTKEEMKKVMGGVEDQQTIDCCTAPKKLAHCFWGHGACTNQKWGRCPAGDSSCQEYCVEPVV